MAPGIVSTGIDALPTPDTHLVIDLYVVSCAVHTIFDRADIDTGMATDTLVLIYMDYFT
jgi:hypothetical protein